MKNIDIQTFFENDADLNKIGDLYCLTFAGDHYSPSELEDAISNINKHAGYEGFKGLKATDKDRGLIGFAYGYTSLAHQFYREKLEMQLTVEQKIKWLGDCFEFVEMAVALEFKRQGIGGLLHDTLLRGQAHKMSVLTTPVDNFPALQLYKKKGWKFIKEDAAVISESHPQVIMGKEL